MMISSSRMVCYDRINEMELLVRKEEITERDNIVFDKVCSLY